MENRGYRLPTEAEWEYACRAGAKGRFNTGDDDASLQKAAWYGVDSGGTTHPAAHKQANAWGLYDMHGNVWEWCQDWYGNYPPRGVTDPAGPPSGTGRTVRGGGYSNTAYYCRSASRYGYAPSIRQELVGLRLCFTD